MKQIRRMKEYEKLIKTMAWRYLPSFRKVKELDDLIQDGWEVYVRLREEEKKEPLTCHFGTALSIQIKQKWMDELDAFKTQKRGGDKETISLESEILEKDEDRLNPALMHDPTGRINRYRDLSEEMKMVVQLLIDVPSELAMLTKSFGLRNGISNYLGRYKKWDWKRIERMRQELLSISA
jgi:hypothetical protein